MRQFVLALAFAAATGGIALSGSIAAPTRGEIAVVFAPFTTQIEAWRIVREAGGYFVAPTRLPNVVVAFAPDEGFQQRAKQMGAILFFKASGLCAPLQETSS